MSNLLIGLVTITVAILWQVFLKGNKKQLAILVGLTAGYVVALFFGKVDLSITGSWFALPKLLPYAPAFRLDAIISVCIIYTPFVSAVLHRNITPEEVSGTLAMDSFDSMLGGLLLLVIGQIPVSEFMMIAEAGFTQRNKMIASISLVMGKRFVKEIFPLCFTRRDNPNMGKSACMQRQSNRDLSRCFILQTHCT